MNNPGKPGRKENNVSGANTESLKEGSAAVERNDGVEDRRMNGALKSELVSERMRGEAESMSDVNATLRANI